MPVVIDNGGGDGVPAGPSVADLFKTAVTTLDAAKEAGMDAADALKAATDNIPKFGTMAVMGDSSMAEMNAQAILVAKGAVDDALDKAIMARTSATTAKEQAEAVSEDDANRLTLIAELEEAIAEANEQIKAIEMIQAGKTLADAVAAVTGDNELSRCLLLTVARWWRWRSAARSAPRPQSTGPE